MPAAVPPLSIGSKSPAIRGLRTNHVSESIDDVVLPGSTHMT